MQQLPPEDQLLSRDDFREFTFKRDNLKCVVPGCNQPAQDAHHIVERRLFADGGYRLGNGASVCGVHHLECEATIIECDQLRQWVGISKAIYPENIESPTDKWGNPLLENGKRGIGPLFFDPSVQKVLGALIYDGTFVQRTKYGRTPHLPWSLGVTKTHNELDDMVLESAPWLAGETVIVTEKMDGENTTMYHGDGNVHARSLDGRSHPTRSHVKALHARIAYDIPPGMRIVGENMQAMHSLKYRDIPPFLVFAVFETTEFGWACLSWDSTKEWCALLELPIVPELYRGPWDQQAIRKQFDTAAGAIQMSAYGDEREGYVVRTSDRFPESKLVYNVAKFVRQNHVRTDRHWMHRQIGENELVTG